MSSSERDAAVKAVEAALADGRIVQADRDHRLGQLRHAQTSSEVRMIVHDLASRDQPPGPQPTGSEPATWETYAPPDQGPEPGSAPAPPRPYGPPRGVSSDPTARVLFGTRRSSSGLGCMLIPLIFFLVISGSTILGVISSVRDGPSGSDGFGGGPDFGDLPAVPDEEAAPNLFRVPDFNQLREAVEAETGSTTVFRVVLYPTYASVAVPAQATGQRELSYHYDGELDDDPSRGKSLYQRFDLADVDPAVIRPLVRQARTSLVEEPTSIYAIIQRPDDVGTAGAWFSVYASNDFQESGYLEADLRGKVLNRFVSE